MATTVPPSGRDRGQRTKANANGLVLCILQPDESFKEYCKNGARFTRLAGETWNGRNGPSPVQVWRSYVNTFERY
jgi:hypothetical protein